MNEGNTLKFNLGKAYVDVKRNGHGHFWFIQNIIFVMGKQI